MKKHFDILKPTQRTTEIDLSEISEVATRKYINSLNRPNFKKEIIRGILALLAILLIGLFFLAYGTS